VKKDVALTLVSMPWNLPTRPSIQVGVLAGFVRSRAAAAVTVLPLHVDWYEFIRQRIGLGADETLEFYRHVAERLYTVLAGDWVFAGCLTPGFAEQEYVDFLVERRLEPGRVDMLVELRRLAPDFITEVAQQVVDTAPDVLGLTTTFSQTMPSLALAQRVKKLSPTTRIVLGGSNCDEPMGSALLRSYDFLDGVVSGEGERPLAHVVDCIRQGADLSSTAGLTCRDAPMPRRSLPIVLDGLDLGPRTPDYDDYFRRLHTSVDHELLVRECRLPIEMSRGCWWGEKHHCTFCGLNGTAMKFRRKDSGALVEQITQFASRYGVLDFYAVDNILDMQHLREAMPQLAEQNLDITLFFEVKANLRRDQLQSLRDAGVDVVQPGIESLDTDVLKAIDKGVSTHQNIRFLRDCEEVGLVADWNVILGLPEETPERLRKMIQLVPSLTHLRPPNVSILQVERFSPHHDRANDFGIRILGPRAGYKYVYDLAPDVLMDVAYIFTFGLTGDHPDNVELRRQLRTRIDIWRKRWHGSSLTYRRGPDLLVVDDDRCGLPRRRVVLREVEAQLFDACLSGTSMAKLCALGSSLDYPEDKVDALLGEWARDRLVYQEGNSVIALPISVNRPLRRDHLATGAE
jgi:ribosomal peptide maturation radical SAM protein 1